MEFPVQYYNTFLPQIAILKWASISRENARKDFLHAGLVPVENAVKKLTMPEL